MGKIKVEHHTSAIKPELTKAEYRSVITDLVLEYEPKFDDDVIVTLHLSQASVSSLSPGVPATISDDGKVIHCYYQIYGYLNSKKNKIERYDTPSDVYEAIKFQLDALLPPKSDN
jgi:hypothetical protein